MTTPTEKEIAALVDNLIATVDALHDEMKSGRVNLPMLTDLIEARDKLHQPQKPRVAEVRYYSSHPDGSCKSYEPFMGIELTDAVKLALDEAGIEYNG